MIATVDVLSAEISPSPVGSDHARPRVVTVVGEWNDSLRPDVAVTDPAFLKAAGQSGRLLPAAVHDNLVDFGDDAGPSGALLIHGVPVGKLAGTPDRPTAVTSKDTVSEFNLLTVGRRLGQPVGYLPELGGAVIQNIVPMRTAEDRQVSTSSKVELMFHTEAAFHPYRPRYLVLLCLRGDRERCARTTVASIREIAPLLGERTRTVLFEPRFRTAPDESYVGPRGGRLGAPSPVLAGVWDRPSMVFDADLMQGVDSEARSALVELSAAVAAHHTGVVLEAGDLLVVDNDVAVHGRTSFRPRFDGTDRWLQRTFVVADLSLSAADRVGRVIATRFDD
jgi:L-asparagine oxygenase